MSLGNFIKSARNIMRQDPGINGDAQRLEQLVWMLFLKIYDTKESDWELIEDNFQSILPEELRWRNWADTQKKEGMRGDDLMRFVNERLFQGEKLGNSFGNAETPEHYQRCFRRSEQLHERWAAFLSAPSGCQ